DRGADPFREVAVDLTARDASRVHRHLVGAGPAHLRPEGGDDLQEGEHVTDPRDVLEGDGLVGEHGRRETRERRVLVAGGADAAREGAAALDEEGCHGAPSRICGRGGPTERRRGSGGAAFRTDVGPMIPGGAPGQQPPERSGAAPRAASRGSLPPGRGSGSRFWITEREAGYYAA